MCRLFGLSAAPHRVRATFWLLDAPDSLETQSHKQPDGTGLGTYRADGSARVEKQPIAAYEDAAFAREARYRESATFLAHVRHASTGGLDVRNTHPFEQHGRLFAHNGVVHGLDALDAELGDYRKLVGGETDSERIFALITQRVDRNNGDVTTGLVDAVRWIADNIPVYALNVLLITPTDLWALRYPQTHHLYVLQRHSGGHHGGRHLDHASRTLRVRSAELAQRHSVIVASERMDENPAWRELAPGELLHVDGQLRVESRIVLDSAPRHLLSHADLSPRAAASQAAE
ncbi:MULTISPECIES: class II glutamine amidotransferase [unclassified Nocardia]|uniref:class II glutamine amidotransferase n=1 Tax=unclassified Nocardia TaxID=2637762 RepID=UPI001CE410B6|nr:MULTISPECIES: class II glutamine amidotransferase [unclassified Nocardia]